MELVSWYIGRLETLRGLRVQPKAAETVSTPRKPSAIEPSGSNARAVK